MTRFTLATLLSAAALAAQTAALTPKEISDGWIQLFDGETTFGWAQEGKAQWTASGGVLTPAGENGWLRTTSPFTDFILKLDYRTGAEGNSGIFLRSAKEGAPHETGYELQIWNQHPEYPTGSLVNHIKGKRVKPAADQWHTYEIQATGDRWTIKLDGKKVLDGRDAKSRMGHIGLQYNQDKKIEFRNIRLKPLGLQPIFDGKSLAGWKQVQPTRPAKQPAEWSVKDGAIHVVHGGGQLETEKQWADFILQLDIRTNPQDPKRHPNSGVFLRGEAGRYWSGYESQIRNEYKGDDRTQPVDYGTGGVYGRVAARRVVSDDNKYFTKTIVARGRHISVWIDGYQVSDFEETDDKRARVNAGPISLQAHDPTTDLDFRNLRLVELGN